MMEHIPLADLKAQYLSLKFEIDSAINKVIADSSYIRGPAVKKFEDEFAEYIGTSHSIGCGNGTDAIELILKALGLGPGDEVIVPAVSWIATAEAVSNIGAIPVFADIKMSDCTIDTTKLEGIITPNTKAIIPVHLYGCPCDMDELMELSRKHNLFVIEDCAQSHGAEYLGKKTGTFGIASAFSFFPSKNLGAFGDAGAVVTNDSDLAHKIRMIANHGQKEVRHKHQIIGRNSRLDSIQAAVLSVKLRSLDKWNDRRIELASLYCKLLVDNDVIKLINTEPYKKNVYHLLVIRHYNRDVISNRLNGKNIATALHYPKPLPFLEAYAYKNHLQDEFPVAVKVTNEILSIPLYPEMSDNQVEYICRTIVE